MTDERDFAAVAMALAELEQLDVPALELLYKLECSGEDFYNLLADRIDDERAADLFRRNGREEMGHARRVGREETLHGERITEAMAILGVADPV